MEYLKKQFVKIGHILRAYLFKKDNEKKWIFLKNKYKGKRIFLIGNGPSLNNTPLYLLKNDYTLVFNRFHMFYERLNWKPKFYMCIDPEVLTDISNEINENLENYDYVFLHSQHSQNIRTSENLLFMHPIARVPYFSERLPLASAGGTVAYIGLQVLFYLGFKEIYLIGVDQNYVIHETAKITSGIKIQSQNDDDPNHFDPRYFGKGRKYHQPVLDTQIRMIKAFEKAASVAKRKNIKIFNAGINGKLEVYPRIDFNSLFNYSEKEKFNLFAETFQFILKVDTFSELSEKVNTFTEIGEAIKCKSMFLLNMNTKTEVRLSNYIMEYYIFGPYNQLYLFIKRQ